MDFKKFEFEKSLKRILFYSRRRRTLKGSLSSRIDRAVLILHNRVVGVSSPL